MPAQIGSSVLLQYGTQAAHQSGSAVLLSYDVAAGSSAISIRSQVTNRWAKAVEKTRPLASPQPATLRSDQHKDAPWNTAVDLDTIDVSGWVPALRKDTERKAKYGAYGDMLNEDRSSKWVSQKAMDDRRAGLWSIFGEMLNEDRYGKWIGSKPADAKKFNAWRGYLIPSYRLIPWERPLANAVNFSVVGGSPMSMQLPGTLAVMRLPIAVEFGPDTYVAHYLGDPLRQYVPPTRANFIVGKDKRYELALDGTGQPIEEGSGRDPYHKGVWGVPVARDKEAEHPWLKYSRPLNPGWGIFVPGTVTPIPGESIIVPVQRVYIVINEIQFLRVSTMTPISASNISISFDCDSWLPTFSATIPESARDAVMPDPSPVEVEALINGTQFRFFVEKIARSRQFGQRTINIGGRGIACELDAPYAVASQHTNGSTMTAQQLITDALGYSTYTQTWNITDWSVPANTFSMYGTPAQVAGAVAEASGSVLQADWELRDLRMLPRYPVKPWDWVTATPDYVIPGAVAQTESVEWIEKPTYNVVYVSGEQVGVLGQVKRTGTAGDLPAPMYTHPLITHNDAARQKGIAILGDTGRKAMMQISMPVLPATGVIDVCKLIEFNDGSTTRRGIVRANQISVNWPTVRQTLTVEAAA